MNPALRRFSFGWWCLVALFLLQSGCSSWRMWVTVQSHQDTNQGRPLHVLVRTVSSEQYRDESYADVVQLAVKPDKTVIRTLLLEPNQKRRMFLTVPSDKSVGIYLLLDSTTGSWKLLLPPPLPWTISVPLGRTGVIIPQVKECRLGRGLP